MTVPDDLSALDEKPFAEAVVKFEELLAQSGRAFLIGAGCSKCAGLPLTAELTQEALSSDALDCTTKALLGAIRDLFVCDAGPEKQEDVRRSSLGRHRDEALIDCNWNLSNCKIADWGARRHQHCAKWQHTRTTLWQACLGNAPFRFE